MKRRNLLAVGLFSLFTLIAVLLTPTSRAQVLGLFGRDGAFGRLSVGSDSDAASILLQRLKTEPPLESEWIPEALSRLGKQAIPEIVAAFKQDELWVRYGAASALALMKENAASAIPTLMEELDDKSTIVRFTAGKALFQIGPESIPPVMEGLKSPQPRVRLHCAYVLSRFGALARDAILALANALYDQNTSVRAAAADALGAMGKAAKSALPDLLKARNDKESWVKNSAAEAKMKIDPDDFEAGLLAMRAHQPDKAIASFRRWLGGHPDDAIALLNIAHAYLESNEIPKALKHFDAVSQLQPQDARPVRERARIYYLQLRDYPKAVAEYRKVTQLAPTDAAAWNALAWIQATCSEASVRDGKEAVRCAQRACALRKTATFTETLAAAYAESGDFDEAVKVQAEALRQRGVFRSAEQVRRLQARLELYKGRKAYREK
jgi:tetratricopeptide (TPR) repeat protein